MAFAVLVTVISSASPAGAQVSTPENASYRFDAASADENAGTLTDLTGNENHATMYNFEDPSLAFHGGDSIDPRYITFDGVDDFIGTALQLPAPEVVSMTVTFRTTVAGGKVAGFETSQSGTGGSQFDRHLYIDTDGRLRFGAWNGGPVTIMSLAPVNDGQWHTALATLGWDNVSSTSTLALYLDGDLQETLESTRMTIYNGYWRIGGGSLSSWPSRGGDFFQGDIASFHVDNFTGSAGATPTPTPTPAPPEATATATATPAPQATTPTPGPDPSPVPQATPTVTTPGGEGGGTSPHIGVKGDVSNNSLHLDITTSGIANPAVTLIYVVREDGTEWLVGPAAPQMTWAGEPVTGRYRIEAREPGDGESEARVVAAASIPVFAAVGSTGEILGTVGIGVAVVTLATVAGTAPGGFSATAFGQNVLKFFLTEKVRQRTRKFDRARVRSWHAATIAFVLMALLVAAGSPGALSLEPFGRALLVAGVAAVVFRGGMLLGQVLISHLADRKPRYLVWIAGTVTMALTSLALHTPFGYTGYVDRAPADRAREARFAAAALGLMVAISGVFLGIGLATRLVFAETGISMTVGALGISVLPFPGITGNAIWKWSRPVGVGVAMAGFVPYFLFQYGLLPPGAIFTMAITGALVFAGVVGLELWHRRAQKTETPAPAAPVPPAPAAAG